MEKIHLKFCKRYLEVNNKASDIACRAELGRLQAAAYPDKSNNYKIFCLFKQQR